MNNKRNIIIALICAAIVTCGAYFTREIISAPFSTVKPEINGPIDHSNVSGSEFFEGFGNNNQGDAKGDLGTGKLSYNALSKTYQDLKSLSLSIKTSTVVLQDGKVMDSKDDNQEFKFKRNYKLVVKSSDNQIFCDGKNVTRYIPQAKAYVTEKLGNDFFDTLISGSPAINTIGLLEGSDYSNRIKSYKPVRKETVEGKNCDVIEVIFDGQGQVPDFTQTLWIEEKSGIIIKNYYEIQRTMNDDATGKPTTLIMKVTNITTNYRRNEDIPDKEFKFVPGKDDRKYDPKEEARLMEEQAKLMAEQQKQMEAQKAEQEALAQQGNVLKPGEKPEMTSPQKPPTPAELEKNNPVDKQTYNFKATGFSPTVYKGQKLIIVFWAYGMGDDYMDTVSNFARSTRDKYKLVTINVNQKTQGLQSHVNSKKYNVPVYYMDEKSAAATVQKMQIMTLPAVYFIDEIGVTRGVLYGRPSLGQLIATASEKLDKKEEQKDTKEESNAPAVPKENNSVEPQTPQVPENKEEMKPDNKEEDIEVEIKENPKE